MRIGLGYDIHRLVPGRRLVLGGVEIPAAAGLEGHSDADVAVHSLMDALLGAACLGDIGQHFPSDDDRFRGASSLDLLARVRDLLRGSNLALVNADIVIIAEQPKLAPYIAQMRTRLAAVLGVDVTAISVKATTNEGMGPVGEHHGIAAQAVALLEERE